MDRYLWYPFPGQVAVWVGVTEALIANFSFMNICALLNSRVSCQKGPTRQAYAWQIGPFWQDTLEMSGDLLNHIHTWQMPLQQ